MKQESTLHKGSRRLTWAEIFRSTMLCLAASHVVFIATMETISASSPQEIADWTKKVTEIIWIAYSPPSANPHQGIEATAGAIRKDLTTLRKAQFTGLVTYTVAGAIGREVPKLAEELGFKGVIVGVWNPLNRDEMSAAKRAGKNSIVLGFCVGNEGLGADKRYRMEQLTSAIQELRKATGKPVSTTEEIEDYRNDELLALGDWVFPNAHPYFHGRLDPDAAVRWTVGAYEDLERRSKRPVIFKEVGLPTAGDTEGQLSEAAQEIYYRKLSETTVRFVYFEAFDQPWKTHLSIEPHWGIFRSDRAPKLLGLRLMGAVASSQDQEEVFYVYLDADSPRNHFKPTGYMGDCGDIHIDEACEIKPHSGETCIQIIYDAKGRGPNECNYRGPCKWAGVYWQEPSNNWGKEELFKGKGFDLSDHTRMVFWARGKKKCKIVFKVGGIDERYGDTLSYPRSKTVKLTEEWREYTVNLEGADLSRIIGGFCFVSDWDTNPNGATFYVDDVRFESAKD